MNLPHSIAPVQATLVEHAVTYAHRGWSIIPTRGKKAAGLWKPFQEQAADETTLRRMFGRPNITGLAVILGSASGGLACRDYDRADAYQRWAAEHPDLAAVLPTVQTARGFHVYFAGPEGFTKLDDGEYRAGSGHYCLLPPSAHPDGVLYRWLIPLPQGGLLTLDPIQAGFLPAGEETQAETQANTPHTLHVSDEFLEEAIEATLPGGPGERNRRLFDLARRLKAIMPGAAMGDLEAIVRRWHGRALPFICTKDWLESWIDFRIAWANVKKPAGATMAKIVAAAKSKTPPDADAIAKLVSLCQALQAHHGAGRAWPLSCRMAAKEIGVGHDTAARLLKMLTLEGVLKLARPGGPKGSQRAAEYRYWPPREEN